MTHLCQIGDAEVLNLENRDQPLDQTDGEGYLQNMQGMQTVQTMQNMQGMQTMQGMQGMQNMSSQEPDHFQRSHHFRHSSTGTQWQPQAVDSECHSFSNRASNEGSRRSHNHGEREKVRTT